MLRELVSISTNFYLILSCRTDKQPLVLLLWAERPKACRDWEISLLSARQNQTMGLRTGPTITFTVQIFHAKYLRGLQWDVFLLDPCSMSWRSPLQGIVESSAKFPSFFRYTNMKTVFFLFFFFLSAASFLLPLTRKMAELAQMILGWTG